jgi:hypothetical protein
MILSFAEQIPRKHGQRRKSQSWLSPDRQDNATAFCMIGATLSSR